MNFVFSDVVSVIDRTRWIGPSSGVRRVSRIANRHKLDLELVGSATEGLGDRLRLGRPRQSDKAESELDDLFNGGLGSFS